jgi:UDP-glucose 6-dehydrogenase
LPKDLEAMEALARTAGSTDLFAAAAQINEGRVTKVVRWLDANMDGFADKRVAILGAAFKSQTDDIRVSPALKLAEALRTRGAVVTVFDPLVDRTTLIELGYEFAKSPSAAASDADAIVVATDWPEFMTMDLAQLRRSMRGDALVDGRGMIDRRFATAVGFRVLSLSGVP